MSKKILSIFIMVMALSLLGVSCNNKTTNPGGKNPPPAEQKNISDVQIETALKTALKGLKVNDTDEVQDGKYTKGVYKAAAAASKDPEKGATKTNLKSKKANIKDELGKISIVLDEKTDYTVVDSAAVGTVTLKVSAKEGYKLPAGTSDTIKIEITSDGKTWK